jgi:opacity protein-like surface antigen
LRGLAQGTKGRKTSCFRRPIQHIETIQATDSGTCPSTSDVVGLCGLWRHDWQPTGVTLEPQCYRDPDGHAETGWGGCRAVLLQRGRYDLETQTHNKILPGFTVGAGLETWIYGNLLLRGEYRYAQFSANDTRVFGLPVATPLSTTVNDEHFATIGLTYRFGEL